jgi:RNA polymerase sigma-70 factor (ECF subfamily)
MESRHDSRDGVYLDHSSMRSLFELHFKPLVMFVAKYIDRQSVCEDIVQDVFMLLVEFPKKFETENHVKAYLYTTAKNKALKYLRHNDVVLRHEMSYSREIEDYALFHANVIEEEVFAMLIREVNELPPYCRNVYLLALEGHNNQMIADTLGLTVETVKSYKKEGKTILRKRMQKIQSLILIFSLIGC